MERFSGGCTCVTPLYYKKMPTGPTRPAPALALFDIDGTLLRRAGPHHRTALVDAVERVSGVRVTIDGIPVQGMLDRDIITWMMRSSGVSLRQIRVLMPEIMAKAQSLYVRRCPDLTRKLCPGVRGALRKLERGGVPMGLVTGNLSRIGWRKMDRAGLKGFFRFGAFAEQGHTRDVLARLAVRQARREGWIDRSSVVVLVGDHPNDIKAARSAGARSVAVGTGLCSQEELAAHAPDHLLPDLRHFRLEMLK